MIDVVPAITIVLLVAVLVIQILLLGRKLDLGPVATSVDALARNQERLERVVRDEISSNRLELSGATRDTRQELTTALKGLGDTLDRHMLAMTGSTEGRLESLRGTMETRLDSLRAALEERLTAIKDDNARQLEQMRQTVDEKLQATLEKRLGESFKLVGEQLEAVHRGLGEMSSLAQGVGDLKKVLANVKTRGTWGEVQLGALLEQVLSAEQYAANVAIKEAGERVEFAIKLPGRTEHPEETIWLPIDAKFPIEDYQRLLEAQERADVEGVEASGKQLEATVRKCAGDIRDKYLNPPQTTDFAILFLPTEGLFAEVIRRTGLCDTLQRDCRVVVAGPTTLWSLLNGLQMGFKTLAIERRSSEIWKVLAAVKTEWSRYGDMLVRVQKKLGEASRTIDEAQKRTRVVGRKLSSVQELPAAEAMPLLELGEPGDGEPGEPEADV